MNFFLYRIFWKNKLQVVENICASHITDKKKLLSRINKESRNSAVLKKGVQLENETDMINKGRYTDGILTHENTFNITSY